MPFCERRDLNGRLTGELSEKLLLVQAVLERLSPVDEHDWNFVGELAPELIVGLNINLAPAKPSPAFQLDELFFDDLAQVTSLAGINHDFAEEGHPRRV